MAEKKKEYKVRTYFDCGYNLNEQEQAFAKFFCSDEAYRDESLAFDLAGYTTADNANGRYNKTKRIKAMMERPDLRNYIDDLFADREKNPLVDKHWIIQKLKRIIQESNGSPTIQLKALDSLAKAIGLYNESNQMQQPGEGEEDSTNPADLAASAYRQRTYNVIELKKQVMAEGGENGNTREIHADTGTS